MSKALFNTNTAMMVISGLLKDPTLLHNQERYRLTTNDFDSDFYKIVFGAIYNLSMEGIDDIGIIDIDIYIGQYPEQYKIFQENQGFDFIKEVSRLQTDFDRSRFDMHYDRLKKFTILRDLERAGFDTKEFYNPNVALDRKDKEERKFNELTIDEIVRRIQGKVNEIEDAYASRNYSTTQLAAKGIRDLYFDLKSQPEVGPPIDGDILNYIVRGGRLGKMYLFSAPTGQGKTRSMLGHAASLSFPILDDNKKVIYKEKYYKTLFVTTEQQADEIQTLLLSYVSGVNERKILYGSATADEEERILMAIDIIEKFKDNLIIEVIPDPSIALTKAKMVKHIIQNDVSMIFYDYIFSSPGLLGEFESIRVREDVALMMLSNTIKEVAATYNVFIMTGTQLNDRWENTMVRNQNHIRGSKAVADKIDVGMIGVKLSSVPEEEEIIKEIALGAGLKVPNMVVDLYKNRRGEYAAVKLYKYFDYGTCRSEDIMLMDQNFNIIEDYDKLFSETKLVDLLDVLTGGESDE